MSKKYFLLVLSSFFIIMNICYSNSDLTGTSQELIENILDNEAFCVNRIEGDKVYIKSENITPTDQGILIHLNYYDQLFVPNICSDVGGCFVKYKTGSGWTDIVPKETCSECGWVKRYGVCKNKGCSKFNK